MKMTEINREKQKNSFFKQNIIIIIIKTPLIATIINRYIIIYYFVRYLYVPSNMFSFDNEILSIHYDVFCSYKLHTYAISHLELIQIIHTSSYIISIYLNSNKIVREQKTNGCMQHNIKSNVSIVLMKNTIIYMSVERVRNATH